ncbi:MAG: hypothetical protein P1P89_10105 [Desulfobacterales bacterium]|nr:hypothetical protein [Desulfobacterales bacterium]
MKAPLEFHFKLHKFCPYPLANAMSEHHELPVLSLTAYMGKTEKIERFRFSFILTFTILGSKSAELDQPCFVLMKFQVKLQKTFPKISQEPFSVFAVLKANHKVIAIPDDDNLTTGMLGPPLVSPQIKHVMQVGVGQQGTDTSSLWYALFIMRHRTLFKHACVEPLLNVPQDALVRNPILNELFQPFVGDGIKIATNVCIKHPAYLSRHNCPIQGVERIMRFSPRAKTIRKTEKVGFVDRIQYLYRGPLRNFIFQHSHAKWPLTAVGFGYERSSNRLRPIRSTFQPAGESLEISFQIFAVVPPCLTVYFRRSIALKAGISLSKVFNVINMMSERGKPQPFIPTRCLSYPFHRIWQVVGVSLHRRSFPGTVPRTCFVGTDSPWPDPFPPQSPPAGISPAFCSTVSSVHMGLSDFPCPFIAVVLPWDSQRGL